MKTLTSRTLDLAVQIQQIPAPTFQERRRAEFAQNLLAAEGLADVSMDSLCNVYARFPGKTRSQPLVVSAHLDTVFPAGSENRVSRQPGRIHAPGIGDNALGVAALFGLLWTLRERETTPSADVWLVANVCEEGLGDLRGMKEVVARFGEGARAYLVIEGTALGQVYHRAIGVRRYRVKVSTEGGHSWSDYGKPSAVHELAGLVTQLTSMHLPTHPRTTLNVGMIAGGSGVNVVASDAQFELDVRSETAQGLGEILPHVEARMRSLQKPGVSVDIEVVGERPAGELSLDHPLVKLAGECLSEQGITPTFTAGSTDANIPLSRGLPALVLGTTTGGGAHTPHEYIDTAPLKKGMRQLVRFVERVLEI
jgi:tripeptide aminopeptidase